MYAQQKADIDAHEIRNSPRIQLQSIEGPYATEMQELNFARRRLISDHMQRTDAPTHKFHCAVAAENSARLTAKASTEEARLAAEAQCMQATEAIGHMKKGRWRRRPARRSPSATPRYGSYVSNWRPSQPIQRGATRISSIVRNPNSISTARIRKRHSNHCRGTSPEGDATERAQAELFERDHQTWEEALRAQRASNHAALSILKKDIDAHVADSYRAIEALTQSQKAQNHAAEHRAQEKAAMLRQLHGILADFAIAQSSRDGSGGSPGPPPGLPSSATDHESNPSYPRVKTFPRGSAGSPTVTLPTRSRTPDDYDFPSDDEGSEGPSNLSPPNDPYGRGRGNGHNGKGRKNHDPDDPNDPDEYDFDEDDPDGDGGGNVPTRRGSSPTMKPSNIKEAESIKVAIFPEPPAFRNWKAALRQEVAAPCRPR